MFGPDQTILNCRSLLFQISIANAKKIANRPSFSNLSFRQALFRALAREAPLAAINLDTVDREPFNNGSQAPQATQARGQIFCQPRRSFAMSKTECEVPTEEIARRAYELWEARGRPAGDGSEDWDAAVAELTSRAAAATAASAIGGSGCGARSSAAADAPFRPSCSPIRGGEFPPSTLASCPFSARCEHPARAI